MTINKGSLFLGFRKNRYGGIEKIYYDPEYKNSQEFRNTVTSIARGTGLTGGGLSISRASRTIDRYIDSNFSNLPISRRSFLKGAAVTAITGGLVSCDRDDTPNGEIVNPPTPVVTGPTELTIPGVGMGVTGTFDSAGSKDVSDLYWQLIKPLSMMDNLEQKGSEAKIDIKFTIPGDNEVRLITDNSGGRRSANLKVKVNPPKLPEQNYDLPLLLLIDESPGFYSTPKYAIHTLDSKTMELTRLFSGKRFYDFINWDPTGQRLVFVANPVDTNDSAAPYKVTTYDLIKGTFKMISNNSQYLAWSPKWSPIGDWIAYLDDSKSINRSIDVVTLMRPDGSEQFYLDGNGQTSAYTGSSLSWDPEGKRLIANGGKYTHYIMAIYDKLFSGNPTVEFLPTDAQIERYYDAESEEFMRTGLTKEIFLKTFDTGSNGLAWSPDGEVVVYTSNFGLHPENYYAILSSRIDGTGDIQTIARAFGVSGVGRDFWLPIRPTWTPDGSTIYFSARKYDVECLYKYDLASKKYEEVILPISKVSTPCLYG